MVVLQLMPDFGGDWKSTCPCKDQSTIGEILIALIFQCKLVVNYKVFIYENTQLQAEFMQEFFF